MGRARVTASWGGLKTRKENDEGADDALRDILENPYFFLTPCFGRALVSALRRNDVTS